MASSSSRVDIQQRPEQPDSWRRTRQDEASQIVSSCSGGRGAAQGGGHCDNKTSRKKENGGVKTGGEQQHRKGIKEGRDGGHTHIHQERGPRWSDCGGTYPAGAAALTFGEEQRGTLQNRPRRGPILPGDQKKTTHLGQSPESKSRVSTEGAAILSFQIFSVHHV